MSRDRVTGLISLVLGVIVAVATIQLPVSLMAGDIGPKVFPGIASGILIVSGTGLLITGKKKSETYFTKNEFKRLMGIGAIVVAYVICMDLFGFIGPSMIMLYVLSTMFTKDKKSVWWQRIIFSVVVTLILYFSFSRLLSLKMPSGKLF